MPKRKPRPLIAWETDEQNDMPVEPAATSRDWMDQSNNRFAYRCLPLVIANQAGWTVRNPIDFQVRWNGGPTPGDLQVRFPRGRLDQRVCSHFGHGVLTFGIPYLFRTPKGVNLWVKGPANWLKDGIQPLEGIVETDWSHATFTMNWKVTRKGHTIRFQAGDPICMIVPVPRGLAESLDPVRRRLANNAKLNRAYRAWCESRVAFNKAIGALEPEAVRRGWQRDYMLGIDADGDTVPDHQTKVPVRAFRREP
jgi:hypothetical protein